MSSNKMENIGIIIDILTHEDDIFCEKAEIVLEQMMALHKAGSSKELGDDGAYEMKPFTGKEDIEALSGGLDSDGSGDDDEDEEDMSRYSRYFGKKDGEKSGRPVMTVSGEDPVEISAGEISESDSEDAEAQDGDGFYENGDYEPRRGNNRPAKPKRVSSDDEDHYEPRRNRRKMTVSGEENAKPTTVPSVQGPADEATGDYEAVGTVEHESSVPSAYPPGIQAQVDALQRAIAYGFERKKVQSVRERLTQLSTEAFDKGDINERQLELLLNM